MSVRGSILPLAVEGLVFEAGATRLIHDVSFTLLPGARTVLLGPNGAGKSLILRLAHGLLRPTAGTVRWAGAGTRPAREVARRQAMVFQRPVLLRRSVRANLVHALAVRGVPRADRRARAEAALAAAQLAPLADRPARTLSGGEQQRLALARAWAVAPEVLFLDEPTANLDPAATRAVEALIAGIHAGGTKIVMTTHDLAQARRLADEVLFVHKGRIHDRGPAAAFFDAPATAEARAFLRGDLLW